MHIAQAVPLADSWGMHGDVGAGWWIVMVVVMMLFWGAVVLGVIWLVRGTTRGEPRPLEILERRFAEGEISEEEYRARRAVLAGGRTGREPGP